MCVGVGVGVGVGGVVVVKNRSSQERRRSEKAIRNLHALREVMVCTVRAKRCHGQYHTRQEKSRSV